MQHFPREFDRPKVHFSPTKTVVKTILPKKLDQTQAVYSKTLLLMLRCSQLLLQRLWHLWRRRTWQTEVDLY